MKRLMMTAAALALLTTAAQADTARTAKMLGISATYDKACEKIPNFEAMARAILAVLPADEVLTGLKQAQDMHNMMGRAQFCSTYKPVADAANAAVR